MSFAFAFEDDAVSMESTYTTKIQPMATTQIIGHVRYSVQAGLDQTRLGLTNTLACRIGFSVDS
jgi:hypothetical protein